jgi:hypothetical protein
MKVSFRVEHEVRPGSLGTLRLFANGSEVALRRAQPGTLGHFFEATVPKSLLRPASAELELRFEVAEGEGGIAAGASGEPGDVGLAFDWLRIEPAADRKFKAPFSVR